MLIIERINRFRKVLFLLCTFNSTLYAGSSWNTAYTYGEVLLAGVNGSSEMICRKLEVTSQNGIIDQSCLAGDKFHANQKN